MNIIIGYILTITYVFLIIFICQKLYQKQIITNNLSRKLIHIFVGFAWIIMYLTLKDTIHQIIIPALFILLNYLSYHYNLIKSMERTTSNTPGTIYFAISMTIMAFISYLKPELFPLYGLSLFIMSLGDGLAPIISQLIPSKQLFNTSKTITGTLTIFITSILIYLIFNHLFILNFPIYQILILSLISSLIELFSKKGVDNILLPLSNFFISCLILL